MKTYSTLFTSSQVQGRFAMSTCVSDSVEDAVKKMVGSIIVLYGDLGWTPTLTNVVDVPMLGSSSPATLTIEPTDYSKNWLMSKIVEDKNKKLFNAAKQYFTKSEVALLTEKLQCKK